MNEQIITTVKKANFNELAKKVSDKRVTGAVGALKGKVNDFIIVIMKSCEIEDQIDLRTAIGVMDLVKENGGYIETELSKTKTKTDKTKKENGNMNGKTKRNPDLDIKELVGEVSEEELNNMTNKVPDSVYMAYRGKLTDLGGQKVNEFIKAVTEACGLAPYSVTLKRAIAILRYVGEKGGYIVTPLSKHYNKEKENKIEKKGIFTRTKQAIKDHAPEWNTVKTITIEGAKDIGMSLIGAALVGGGMFVAGLKTATVVIGAAIAGGAVLAYRAIKRFFQTEKFQEMGRLVDAYHGVIDRAKVARKATVEKMVAAGHGTKTIKAEAKKQFKAAQAKAAQIVKDVKDVPQAIKELQNLDINFNTRVA